ncbi:MAG: hypothetical protein WBV82_17650 [Myxococcaceae bacterium]
MPGRMTPVGKTQADPRHRLKRVERVLGEGPQFMEAVALEQRNESAQEGRE